MDLNRTILRTIKIIRPVYSIIERVGKLQQVSQPEAPDDGSGPLLSPGFSCDNPYFTWVGIQTDDTLGLFDEPFSR
ncbi:hypothetical protein CDEST_01986 [Colletotrichum destructivum]|uniref:Uncharacterized protein n=1 Tax=Colletotrichum destructivum TaxID=34406 RepID=A0AAX4I0W4_9PEZI|nr:hypothetical protein CDEST_01986 [Colletotrichum destructivum]